jgi:hypothetical protein
MFGWRCRRHASWGLTYRGFAQCVYAQPCGPYDICQCCRPSAQLCMQQQCARMHACSTQPCIWRLERWGPCWFAALCHTHMCCWERETACVGMAADSRCCVFVLCSIRAMRAHDEHSHVCVRADRLTVVTCRMHGRKTVRLVELLFGVAHLRRFSNAPKH